MRILLAVLISAMLAQPAELPVRQVVLYKHGVGFFERSGRLGPGESARLEFNAAEMNDVLKSLTVEEKGGGRISAMRYDAMDLLDHKLQEFPFEIGASGLPDMLDHLHGAQVELKVGTETVTGAIVKARTIPGSEKQSEHDLLTLLLDSGDLRTIDLSAVSGLRLADPKLQQQFKDYLAVVAAARSKEKRSVYIDSTDAKERDVVASYMIPAAVWKSSYRLIFGASGQPVLEGWAIVDNTTGEDWTKVQLSLVSGRPISFVTQLYAPKYVTRPEAELADDRAARPVVHAPSMTAPPAPAPRPVVARNEQQQFQAGVQSSAALVVPDLKAATGSSIAPGAEARELGELFEYRVAQPVTIRRNESAMLPFLQQPIDGRKLLIYSDHSSIHPTNAVQLNNSSGKTLDGGPVTVYDGGSYGGEALMETLKAGDRRLISYAVDLGTRITEAFDSKQALVREVHATRGVLTTRLAAEESRTYTIRNVDQKAKTLIIEHPLRPMYTLLNQKPSSKTATNYRFEVALGAGATEVFTVNEERVFDQTYTAASLTPDLILSYVQNRSLSDSARRQLEGIAGHKTQIAATDRGLQEAASQVRDLVEDENRIRQNMMSLNGIAGQQQIVQNYARQIDAHEQQVAGLRDRQGELQKQKAMLQTELDRMIEALSF
jgi:hypothetical protein